MGKREHRNTRKARKGLVGAASCRDHRGWKPLPHAVRIVIPEPTTRNAHCFEYGNAPPRTPADRHSGS